ncbi:cyd operon YbgE family protein [Suttonella ornithocola]|uniref:Cyd operon protein YbgE n=1 Tax=Suttonella ornithocola TaxID=279832 RepID=A0A380MQR2_9GAMM|nr:cyd operon YbgE family protein [Suttonella ornithocola]SUO94969.1 Uncharacterised protein [Suttonella ornithocola]
MMSKANPPTVKTNFFLLFWGSLLMISLSIMPMLIVPEKNPHVSHRIAMFLFWSMSAALVRGFGYIPTHRIPRYLLGGWATVITALIAIILWLITNY